jgi:hypothetical protein
MKKPPVSVLPIAHVSTPFIRWKSLKIYTNSFEMAASTSLRLVLGDTISTPLVVIQKHAKHAHN